MADGTLRQEPRRLLRRPLDVATLFAGTALLAAAIVLASADSVSALEEDLFRFVNEWPDWVETPAWPFMQAGALAAVPASALAVLVVFRRRRLAAALFTSGMAAWLLAKVVKLFVERERPAGLIEDVIQRPEWTGLGFVSGHAAVVFALAVAASPHVPRRWKWLLWLFPAATVLLRIYTGAHLPLDVVGGAGLGMAIGAAVNLALGIASPRSKPA